MNYINRDAKQIMAKNPETGNFMNVAPLFELLNNFDSSTIDMKQRMEHVMRFIITTMDADNISGEYAKEFSNIVYDMYNIIDMFDAMTEYGEKK